MLFFIPWALLIVAVIVAVPVAVKMSPSTGYTGGGNGDAEMDEYAVEEDAAVVDDLGADPNEFGAEPIGDDAFADFN